MPLLIALLILAIVPVVPPAPMLKVPCSILVKPLYVFAAVNDKIPEPACVKLPVPLTALDKVMLSLRLKISVPLSTMLLVVSMEPFVVPSPTIKMPLVIVVTP